MRPFAPPCGGDEGNRSRLRARSGSALTAPRAVIHYRPVRFPSNCRFSVPASAAVRPFAPPCGGDEGNRTLDPLLAGQVLSQLSYTPVSGELLKRAKKIEQQNGKTLLS